MVHPVFRPEVVVTARVLWARYILLVFMKYDIRIYQTLFLVKIFLTF